jgi:hypothetical protein
MLMPELTEASGAALAGAAARWTDAVWQLGTAFAPIVAGQVFSQTHSLPATLMTLACGPILAVAAPALVTEPGKRNPGAQA